MDSEAETVRIERFWLKQPDPSAWARSTKRHYLAVKVTLWFAVRDILRYFHKDVIHSSEERMNDVSIVVHHGSAGECKVFYIPDNYADLVKLSQFLKALYRDTVSARAILCDLAGIEDIWDARRIAKSRIGWVKFMTLLEAFRRGIPLRDLFLLFF